MKKQGDNQPTKLDLRRHIFFFNPRSGIFNQKLVYLDMKLAAWREQAPACWLLHFQGEINAVWVWVGMGVWWGVENSLSTACVFQDISFIDASLRPEYSECGPCITVGLHLLRTEVEGKYSETFPASWHCYIAKCVRQVHCHNKEGINEFKCFREVTNVAITLAILK